MRSSNSAARRVLSSLALACLMGSPLVLAQELGSKSAGQTMEQGDNGHSSQALASSRSTSQEQKAALRSDCERDRDEARAELQASYKLHMRACARQVGSFLGYFKEQGKQFLLDVAGRGTGSCSTSLTREFVKMNAVFDRRRDACVLAANTD